MSERTGAWYADPTHRHAKRYFDGKEWTEYVADEEGHQTTDPLSKRTGGNGHSAASTRTVPSREPDLDERERARQQAIAERDELVMAERDREAGVGVGADVDADVDADVGADAVSDEQPGFLPPMELEDLSDEQAREVQTTSEARRPLFGFGLGVILAVLGAAALALSFFVLDWAKVAGPGVDVKLKFADLNLNGDPFERLTDWYDDAGYIIGLVVVGLCVLAAFVRRIRLRLVLALAALLMLGWHLLASFDLRDVLDRLGGDLDVGTWVGVGGYGAAVLGVLWGPGRRRRAQATTTPSTD